MSSSAARSRTKSLVTRVIITTAALSTACGLLSAVPFAATADTGATDEVAATIVLRTPDATPASVTPSLTALGLTVDHSTALTVTVHGSAAAVASLKASGTTQSGSVSDSPRLVPGAATVVSGGPNGFMHPRSIRPVTGADFRRAYGASSKKPTGANTPVIATLQLAGWNPHDLTSYATAAHLPAPTARTFTAISVDGVNPRTVSKDSDEVALDQESIYAIDHYARQRAYFAPNNPVGVIDALSQVVEDAHNGTGIMALSTSWGACEPAYSVALLNVLHKMFAAVVAAGVTVFAASGDDGSDDCADGLGAAVDYPASDPLVIGVGGTRLDGDSFAESGWAGSGGGVSSYFKRPAYQSATGIATSRRTVPDIAADADPQSGTVVFSRGRFALAGGTSLSAPVSAALLTAELGSRGIVSGGVGDIHRALYTAPAGAFRDITSGYNGTFSAGYGFDLMSGLGSPNWHAVVNRLTLAPRVTAPAKTRSRVIHPAVSSVGGQVFIRWRTGYGAAPACGTNQGQPAKPAAVTVPHDGSYTIWAEGFVGYKRCLVGRTYVTVDSTGPVVSLSARTVSSTVASYAWKVSDKGSGVAKVSAYVLRNGVKIWGATVGAAGQVSLPRTNGSLYQLVVGARDGLGNVRNVKRSLSVPYDDRSFTFSAGWSSLKSQTAFLGGLTRSSTSGAKARLKAYGSHFSLLTTTCPTCGIVAVWVDGKHIRDVSLYSPVNHPLVRTSLAAFTSTKERSIVLVVKGAKVAHSHGKAVLVDGLVAS